MATTTNEGVTSSPSGHLLARPIISPTPSEPDGASPTGPPPIIPSHDSSPPILKSPTLSPPQAPHDDDVDPNPTVVTPSPPQHKNLPQAKLNLTSLVGYNSDVDDQPEVKHMCEITVLVQYDSSQSQPQSTEAGGLGGSEGRQVVNLHMSIGDTFLNLKAAVCDRFGDQHMPFERTQLFTLDGHRLWEPLSFNDCPELSDSGKFTVNAMVIKDEAPHPSGKPSQPATGNTSNTTTTTTTTTPAPCPSDSAREPPGGVSSAAAAHSLTPSPTMTTAPASSTPPTSAIAFASVPTITRLQLSSSSGDAASASTSASVTDANKDPDENTHPLSPDYTHPTAPEGV
ncbi:hypothetical protein Pelo_11529 [Pelomyxa schiedti]|nr:hypothetical protein Pelo_11529 [Pelomyxa schiedti]